MAVSQNGWTAITRSTDSNLVNFPWVTGKVRKGDVYTVLNYVAEQFNKRVEKIDKAKSWGWAYRDIRGASKLSNHASGTAVDFNAPDHWLGAVGTFSKTQEAEIRKILKEVDGVVRWGGDYPGRKDEMHFEINLQTKGSAANVKKVADRIRGAVVPPTIRKGSKGATVKKWQEILRKQGYKQDILNKKLVVADGIFGSGTARATKRFQKKHKLVADGIVGPKTWAKALGL